MTGSDTIRTHSFASVVAYLVIVVFVGTTVGALLLLQVTAEDSAARFADFLPVGYAFGAGMVASVNPCGFLMLPSYIAYQLGTEDKNFHAAHPTARLLSALTLGTVATLGFVAVFAVIGVAVSAGGSWIIRGFPYAGLAIGAGMSLLGLWLVFFHGNIGIMAASRLKAPENKNVASVFLFGTVYAIGSLSCTLPVFLVVVGSALASHGFLSSLSQFVGFALGMGSILIAVTISAALFRGAIERWLKRMIPYIHKTSALFLLGAGFYLIYYWTFLAST